MSRVFYEKINGEFVPTRMWDPVLEESLDSGAWVTVVRPGISITRSMIDIDFAPLQAAGLLAQEQIAQAIYNESRKNIPTSSSGAPDKIVESYNVFPHNMTRAQAQHIADAGVRAMQDQAQELLANPGVRAAYDQFMLICKLTK